MSIRSDNRIRRKARIRAKVRGTRERPRLVVYRSNTALTASLIDDAAEKTILSERIKGKNMAAATTLGTTIAGKAKQKKITKVVFDRGGYQYHGTIKALADAARKEGLVF